MDCRSGRLIIVQAKMFRAIFDFLELKINFNPIDCFVFDKNKLNP